jgi:predicted ATPase/DNA-binding CsgD family transcriptional regulator
MALAPPPGTVAGLPHPLTTLVGREREIGLVRDLLLRQHRRLLTLTGPGGVGKTRLGIESGHAVAEGFPDGVAFVPLAAVREPDFVVPAIAAALGLSEGPGAPLLEVMRSYLAGKRCLLILDNFEQVLPAALLIVDVLRAAPGVAVLVTSRAALRVAGEHEVPLMPLAVPHHTLLADERQPGTPGAEAVALAGALEHVPSVSLFVQRAQAVKPDFTVTPDNAAAIVEICRRLDGLPLAIELTAAWSKLLSPQAMAARLQQGTLLLTGGYRDFDQRHQSLRAAIDWSYDSLTNEEQRLFRRLGVFVGGCALDAAGAVCADEGTVPGDVLMGLAALVDKSLLHTAEEATWAASGEPRYRMLETIREYALDRLAACDELTSAQQLHADFFVALAEAAEPGLLGAEQDVWVRRLQADHDNLREALRSVLARGDAERALRLSGPLWRFWYTQGFQREGVRWLGAALDLPEADRPELRPQRAKALHGCAALEYVQGNSARAVALNEEALAIRRDLGDLRGMIGSLNNLGMIAHYQRDYARAARYYDQTIRASRELKDDWVTAVSLNNAGTLAKERGDYQHARELIEETLRLFRTLGDKRHEADVLNNLAQVMYAWGRPAEAIPLCRTCLATFAKLADKTGSAETLNTLGLALLATGDAQQAEEALQEALALSREVADAWGIALAQFGLARIRSRAGDDAAALTLLRESMTHYQRVEDAVGIASCLQDVAALALRSGDAITAARLCAAVTVAREAIGAPIPAIDRPAFDQVVTEAGAHLAGTTGADPVTQASVWSIEQTMLAVEQFAIVPVPDSACDAPVSEPTATPTALDPHGLTARELEVLRLLADGLSNQEIATRLFITHRTVTTHVHNILGKLGVESRTAAAALAIRLGLT